MRAPIIAALVLLGLSAEAEPVGSSREVRVATDPSLVVPRLDDTSRWFDLIEDMKLSPVLAARGAPILRTEGSLFVGAAIAIRPGPLALPVVPSLRLGYHRVAYDLPLLLEPDRLMETIGGTVRGR